MPEEKQAKPVGLILRIGIMFYDALLHFAVLFFAGVLIAPTFNITMEHPWFPLFQVYIFAISFLFFAWCWTHGGQTLGMKTWKVTLVAQNNRNITWRAALIRYLTSILCWLSCGIGFLWCYTNKERFAWNDMLSKTYLKRTIE